MGAQIGLVGQRADLAVEVAALAARAGASLVSLGPGDMSVAGGYAPEVRVDLVLVDAEVIGAAGSRSGALPGGGVGVRPPGAPVVVICRAGEAAWARVGAADLGCDHVVELPLGAPWLLSQLAPEGGSSVLAVVGAVGGAGATTVAIACAVGAGADCLLVDADPDSPGLDLPLGIPEGAGVRWSQIPDTSEPLDPGSLRSALPEVGGVWVVTGSHVGRGPVAAGDPGGFPGSGRVAGVLEVAVAIILVASLVLLELLPKRRKPLLKLGLGVSAVTFMMLAVGQRITSQFDGAASLFFYFGATMATLLVVIFDESTYHQEK
jgi:hypothetical protein